MSYVAFFGSVASKSTVIKEGRVEFSDKINTPSGASELYSIAFLREKEQKINLSYIFIIYMQFIIFKENKSILIL